MKTVLTLLALLASVTIPAHGLGFELSQSKEELKLEYEVAVHDHSTGRLTITLSIANEGRLKPLNAVNLVVASTDGTGHVDLSTRLHREVKGGRNVYRIHLHRKLASRALLQLRTNGLDGKASPRTWYYHNIELRSHLGEREDSQEDKD